MKRDTGAGATTGSGAHSKVTPKSGRKKGGSVSAAGEQVCWGGRTSFSFPFENLFYFVLEVSTLSEGEADAMFVQL